MKPYLGSMPENTIGKDIARLLGEAGHPLREQELFTLLALRRRQFARFKAALRELLDAGRIRRLKGARYALTEKGENWLVPEDPRAEVTLIAEEAGLPLSFEDEIEAEARKAAARPVDQDLDERLDLRSETIFTIDPADAKDFDDAVSIESRPSGWRIGVHIADVSFYVVEGSRLDAEAWHRGTSVYLVDRVIPMLPEALSAGACSLRPDEEKLAFSCFIDLDHDGRPVGSELRESIIRSRARLSYEEAQAIIEGNPSAGIDDSVVRALQAMAPIAEALARRRVERGTIDFDLPEPLVELDSHGVPISLRARPRLASHRLVEEFMILANEAVARYAAGLMLPFIYRVHEEPDPLQLEEFAHFTKTMGYPIGKGQGSVSRALNTLLQKIEGRPIEQLLNIAMLRHMKQALYCTRNDGHFGLASRAYTHFTSPIRRYPDLIVHRLLKRYHHRAPVRAELSDLEAWLDETAEQASERERIAMDVERESVKLKQIAFMEDKLGEEYEGIVTGVTNFGLFVQLQEFLVDGLIHVSALGDDYYEYEEEKYRLVGRRSRRIYRLGDTLRVQVVRADRIARQLDLLPVEESDAGPAKRKRTADEGD